MNDRQFNRPIFVRDGLYMVRKIASLLDAIAFLESWHRRQRNLDRERTLAVCNDALDGRKPVVAAYVAFTCFAKRVDILEDAERSLPWHFAAQQKPGGTAPS